MRRSILPLVTMVLLAGCGGSSSEAPADDDAGGTFEPLTDTLDRAAGVEDTLRDAAAERRRQLEAQE